MIEKQRPPTAGGFAFFLLEDRSHRVQAVISPQLWDAHRALLRDARVLVCEGEVELRGAHVGLKATALYALEALATGALFQHPAADLA